MALNIEKLYIEETGKWAVTLAGEVDISNADELKEYLLAAYEEHSADILIDIKDLSYIDSTGFGVLISLYGDMKKDEHRIILSEPRENVKKLLRITNLDKVLC